MWTPDNQPKYDCSKLRHPSDLTNEAWLIIGPLNPHAKSGGNKRSIDVRALLNGVMYILSTGCQWAALPKGLPPWTTVNDYLRRWNQYRTLDQIRYALYALNREQAGREASPMAAIIDSQSVKSAEKGGLHRPFGLPCGQEDQGQEAARPGRHPRPADARHPPRRRHPGSQWWRAADGVAVRPLPLPAEALCRRWVKGRQLSGRAAHDMPPDQTRDRQAIRVAQVRRTAEALDRRAHHCLAQPMLKIGQGWKCLNRRPLAIISWASVRRMLRRLCPANHMIPDGLEP